MKTNGTWMCVAAQAGIPIREGRMVDLRGHEIAVFNLGDRAMAVENRCPHRGGPLSDGIVAGNSVVCPLHSWKVCLSTGSVLRPAETACVSTYPTQLRDGYIYVSLSESPGDASTQPRDAMLATAPESANAGMQLEL
jgi:nitrite reductase (NADH) small subunit